MNLKIQLVAKYLKGNVHNSIYTNRDSLIWSETVDRMVELDAEHLVPQHGRPISGKQFIRDTLIAYRDGIQFVHDQTVRNMNLGFLFKILIQFENILKFIIF